MNKKDLYFLALAVGIVALFTVLWMISRKPPAMTSRAEHAGITRTTPRETCWECHTPDSKAWLRHPKKGKPQHHTTPCAACHKLPDSGITAANFANVPEVRFSWQDPH